MTLSLFKNKIKGYLSWNSKILNRSRKVSLCFFTHSFPLLLPDSSFFPSFTLFPHSDRILPPNVLNAIANDIASAYSN